MNSFIIWSSTVIIALTLVSNIKSLRWHMYPNTQKCISAELRRNELVKGMYEVTTVFGQQIDYTIKDSNNHILSQNEDVDSGKFTFSIEYDDMYEMCFISKMSDNYKKGVKQEIFIDIKTGIEANNYENITDTIRFKPLELSLKYLEDLSQSIILEFVDMKKRTDELRNTNETTKNRVFYFSILSISCLIILAIWQIFYLKRYFKSKKLIE